MRWFRIRMADISPKHRAVFEQYGSNAAQIVLATTNYFRVAGTGTVLQADSVAESLLPWLTEQYDRAERKETWSITMEAAITVFVLAELVLAIRCW